MCNEQSMIHILVTGVGAIIGQGIIKSLRQSRYSIRIVGMDRSEQSPGPALCDVFYKKPECDEAELSYLDFWQTVLQKEKIALVLPGLELDVFYLNQHRDVLAQTGACLALNHSQLIALSADKWLLGEELDRQGLTCIPSTRVKSWQAAVSELGPPPLLLKPRCGNGSRGIVQLHDENDFDFWLAKARDNWMLQRIVGSTDEEYTVGHFGLGNGKGIVPLILRRRLSAAGNTQAAQVVKDNLIEAATEQLTRHFQPLGPTNYQFRKEGDLVYLLEINPRFSSSTSLRSAFGYNEAEMAIEQFLFQQIPHLPHIRMGHAWRYSEDFIVYDRHSI